MEIKKALPGTAVYREVKQLYHGSFPENERLPFSRMVLLSLLKPAAELLGYYEGDTFCGFSFTVRSEQYLYINFIAVNPALRSHGYGAKILSLLREQYPLPAICDVKAPIEGSDDYAQDHRRIEFWKRNGFDFFDNEYVITNPCGVTYIIASTKAPFDRAAYWALFDHLSFGPCASLRILKRRLRK